MSDELVIQQFIRKSFPVDAVRVTAANMEAVSKWCGGNIQERNNIPFIKVAVQNPINERQTEAFSGDWVLYAGKGFKVYKDAPFRKSFDEPLDKVQAGIGDEKNVFETDTSETVGASASSGPNPGGTTTV
jgi:lysophospholipase L1-like esterase